MCVFGITQISWMQVYLQIMEAKQLRMWDDGLLILFSQYFKYMPIIVTNVFPLLHSLKFYLIV